MKKIDLAIVSIDQLLIEDSEGVEQGSGLLTYYGELLLDGKKTDPRELENTYKTCKSFEQLYQRLSGSFWLLFLDKVKQRIFLINDHIGIVPCYYASLDNKLYISHSLNTLKERPELNFSVSNQAIYNYLYFHCIPSPLTIYNEVNKLSPGTAYILYGDGSSNEQVIFSPEFNQKQTLDTQTLKANCLSIIESSVAENVSDQCGAFLSGGLDSSTVAGMLAKHMSPAKTFSIGFDAKGYDETPYAQLTAEHFGTQHEVLYLQSEQAAEKFIEVAQYFDEPFGNSSAMAAYFCAKFAKGHGVTTLLAGDGGDEFFAGNERYAKQKQFEFYYKLPALLRTTLDVAFNNEVVNKLPFVKKASSYVRQAEVKLPGRLQAYNFVNIVGEENMFDEKFLQGVDSQLPLKLLENRYHQAKSNHPVDKMLFLDWKFTLADNDLIKVNKMCELAGVDVKYPLMSKAVVEFSSTVPAEDKLPGQKLRHFYKETCRGFLADDTLDKSKHGFGLPFGVWLKENETLKNIAMNALESFKQRNIVKNSLIEQAITSHQSVHSGYYGELIWIMVVLELWLQKELDH